MSGLLSSLRLGEKVVTNRLAVAPMTTTQSCSDGTVSEAECLWLERLAADGYGSVITCAAAISKTSIAFPNQMNLGDDRFLPGLSGLARRLRAYSVLAMVQLCHGGSRAVPELTGVAARSASRYELPSVPGFVPPEEFSIAEIERVVEDFADASARAAKAGFGGVEFHGANGYLFTQFISTMTNRREDEFGGSLENRARLARMVVRACRKRVPSSFVVGFRLSFEGGSFDTGLDIDENTQVMRWLAEDGITYGHVSNLDLTARSLKYPEVIALKYIRSNVDRCLPLMCAGGVMSRAAAEYALELGADMVAVGRAAIGNTNVPDRLSRNEPLSQTPYSLDRLSALGVSDNFIRYLTTAGPLSRLNIVQ